MPQVSVLLPCRDASEHLDECMTSLLEQTFTDIEIVAVDDGSTDDTWAKLAGWSALDGRIRVESTAGRGVAAALACAASLARAPIIARMDADDVAMPHRIEEQLAWMERESLGACGTHVEYFPRDVLREGTLRYERWLNAMVSPHDIAREVFVECPIAHPSLMIRREVLERVGGYVERGWPEDYDLVLRLWADGVAMGNVPFVLHRWREHAQRASRNDPRYAPDSFRRCKVHWLKQTVLARKADVAVWGAGRVGKAFARELLRQDVPLRAFVDVDPRKIGQRVYGLPVLPAHGLRPNSIGFVLGAVGSPGAREDIRAALRTLGAREMETFAMVA